MLIMLTQARIARSRQMAKANLIRKVVVLYTKRPLAMQMLVIMQVMLMVMRLLVLRMRGIMFVFLHLYSITIM